MKYLIFVLPFALAACSSATKKEAAEAKDSAKAEAEATKEKAKAATASVGDEITCKIGQEVRRIEIVRSEDGCKLQYTKAGETSEVASGGVGSKHCESVAERMKNNLSQAGFTCS